MRVDPEIRQSTSAQGLPSSAMKDAALVRGWEWSLRRRLALRLERGEVDHEAVLHVAPQQPLVRLVDPLDRDDLDVRDDPALGAEVEHLLGLANTADERPGDPPAPGDELLYSRDG